MKIEKMRCPNCNGELDVSNNEKYIVCKYCNTNLAIDDGIIRVEHIIKDTKKEEKEKSAEAFIKFKDYKKALKIYRELTQEYPYESIYWFKLIECITENFTLKNTDYQQFYSVIECDDYLDKFNALEKNENFKNECNKKYETFLKPEDDGYHRIIEEVPQTKKGSKKLILIIGIVLVIIAISVIILSKKNSNNTNQSTPIQYYNSYELIFKKDASVNDIKKVKNKVNVYLFWGDGCPHCEDAYEWLNSIKDKYKNFFNLYGFEIWYSDNNRIMAEKMSEKLGNKITGVPFFIIGNQTYSGFNDKSKEELIEIIKEQSNKTYDIYFDYYRNIVNN